MKWITDEDGDFVLVPASWTFWQKGAYLYRQGPCGIEAQDTRAQVSLWRVLERAA